MTGDEVAQLVCANGEAFIVQPKIAKLFMNGRSQAVRLPKEFRFTSAEVLIEKEGQNIILAPRPPSWDTFFKETPLPSEDFGDS